MTTRSKKESKLSKFKLYLERTLPQPHKIVPMKPYRIDPK